MRCGCRGCGGVQDVYVQCGGVRFCGVQCGGVACQGGSVQCGKHSVNQFKLQLAI